MLPPYWGQDLCFYPLSDVAFQNVHFWGYILVSISVCVCTCSFKVHVSEPACVLVFVWRSQHPMAVFNHPHLFTKACWLMNFKEPPGLCFWLLWTVYVCILGIPTPALLLAEYFNNCSIFLVQHGTSPVSSWQNWSPVLSHILKMAGCHFTMAVVTVPWNPRIRT